ncbi:DUF6454 family protein [Streptomyces sp. NPDC047043]|uniref:DUF6454 family protein n=1 Tax=Streptomyces sp. NPDC047043 TaxID=3154497 RepID=UPI0033C06528
MPRHCPAEARLHDLPHRGDGPGRRPQLPVRGAGHSLDVRKEFEVKDPIGGIVRDAVTGHPVGNNWGSRHFYEWNERGRRIADWENPQYFINYRKMLCGGVTNLPRTAAGDGTGAVYELGGTALTDLRSHRVLHEVPFQQWSTAGHAATPNPLKPAADGARITMWAAPDDGDEGNGTEILAYRASVAPG